VCIFYENRERYKLSTILTEIIQTLYIMHLHVHLVSDSTGETASSVARAVFSQYEGVEIEEHLYSLVRTKGQMIRVLEEIRKEGGIVMFTIVNAEMREMLKEKCDEMGVLCISILSEIIGKVSKYLGIKTSKEVGMKLIMDEEYFSRVEALNFTLNHDDGQAVWDLEKADVVIVGVSRTSKSPTCIYLANRGYKAANVPFVSVDSFPHEVAELKDKIVVGLLIDVERLVQIRKSRLISINTDSETSYTDIERVADEIKQARKFFTKNKWPIINVDNRSIEETSAMIIQMIEGKK